MSLIYSKIISKLREELQGLKDQAYSPPFSSLELYNLHAGKFHGLETAIEIIQQLKRGDNDDDLA